MDYIISKNEYEEDTLYREEDIYNKEDHNYQ